MKLSKEGNYISEIKQILAQARQKAYTAVNTAMVEAYWLVGKRIVEEEQKGKNRAGYGEEIIKLLSQELNKEFVRGFSLTNLKNFKKFYLLFPDTQKGQTLSDQSRNAKGQTASDFSKAPVGKTSFARLTWSHFERLIRVGNEAARNFYITETASQNWSVPIDLTIAKYSVVSENNKLFANKYLPYLPTEAELVAENGIAKLIIKQQLRI